MKKDEFKVSVIIPAYNVEKYVEKAIRSALIQPEVSEVLVIDDGSIDETLIIIAEMATGDSRIKLLNHKHRKNKGRSASRNLGIKNSTSNFIAFLDADDYYLENRFKNDRMLFDENPDIDGVYNAIGAHFYRNASYEERKKLLLTTIKSKVSPEKLFQVMAPMGNAGHFSGNGLTVRKHLFLRTGGFNEDLEVAEDTEMWIKMSLTGILMPGILDEAVSLRGVHERNVFGMYGTDFYNRNYEKMFSSLLNWAYKKRKARNVLLFFWRNKLSYYLKNKITRPNTLDETYFWIKNAQKYPRLFFNRSVFKNFPPLRKFKNFLR